MLIIIGNNRPFFYLCLLYFAAGHDQPDDHIIALLSEYVLLTINLMFVENQSRAWLGSSPEARGIV